MRIVRRLRAFRLKSGGASHSRIYSKHRHQQGATMTLFRSRRTTMVQGVALAIALMTGGAGMANADALEDIAKAGISPRSART
jgi:hypothetical protein